MKNKVKRALMLLYLNMLVPLIIGDIISTLSTTNQSIIIEGNVLGVINSNIQYTFDSTKLIFLLSIIAITHIILRIKYHKNNKEYIDKIFNNLYKLYSILFFFLYGMSISNQNFFNVIPIDITKIVEVIIELFKFLFSIEYTNFVTQIAMGIFSVSPICIFIFMLSIDKVKDTYEKVKCFINEKFYKSNEKIRYEDIERIVYSRRKQINELENKLTVSDRIIITGNWGIGKSYFIDYFFSKNKDNYHRINIDVMIFSNRKAIKDEFINQLKVIMKKEGFIINNIEDFSHYLDLLNPQLGLSIKNLFRKNNSYFDSKKSLNKDLEKMKKEIIVTFDNLERIIKRDEEGLPSELKEVISFIHELSSLKNIKSIIVGKIDKHIYEGNSGDAGQKSNKDSNGSIRPKYEEQYLDKFYDSHIEINEVSFEEVINAFEVDIPESKNLKDALYELRERLMNEKKFYHEKIKNSQEYKEFNDKIISPRNIEKIWKLYNSGNKDDFYLRLFTFFHSGTTKKIKEEKKLSENASDYIRIFFNDLFNFNLEKELCQRLNETNDEEAKKEEVEKIKNSNNINENNIKKYFKYTEDIYLKTNEYKDDKVELLMDRAFELHENKKIDDGDLFNLVNNQFIWEYDYQVESKKIIDYIKNIKERNSYIKGYLIGIDKKIISVYLNEIQLLLIIKGNTLRTSEDYIYNIMNQNTKYYFSSYRKLMMVLCGIKENSKDEKTIYESAFIKKYMVDNLNSIDDKDVLKKVRMFFDRMEMFIGNSYYLSAYEEENLGKEDIKIEELTDEELISKSFRIRINFKEDILIDYYKKRAKKCKEYKFKVKIIQIYKEMENRNEKKNKSKIEKMEIDNKKKEAYKVILKKFQKIH